MSDFSSTLAELDVRLKAVRAHVDGLRAGLEIDDGQWCQDLANARRQAMALREVIRAERADAKWANRQELDQLVLDLEAAAAARLREQRRTRLLHLAKELEATGVRHRFEARASALNALRLEAVKELRAEAERQEEIKDLPGPAAGDWVSWACNLQEETHGSALESLHKDFPALERFAGEMEESYWPPAQANSKPPNQPPAETGATAAAVAPALTSSPMTLPAVAASTGRPLQNAPVQFDQNNGNHGEAFLPRYDSAPSQVPHIDEPVWAPDLSAQPQSYAATGASSLPDPRPASTSSVVRLKYCDKCGSSYSSDFHVCPDDSSPFYTTSETNKHRGIHLIHDNVNERGVGVATASEGRSKSMLETEAASSVGPVPVDFADEDGSEAAGKEFERLRAIVESKAVEEENPALAEEEEEDDPRRKKFLTRVLAASAIMLVVLAVVIFFFTARLAPKLDKPVTEAVKLSKQVRDSNIQNEIERNLAVLKSSSIQVTVKDGNATLTGQAPSNADVAEASVLTSQVSGVKAVTNNIRVEVAGADSSLNKSTKQ